MIDCFPLYTIIFFGMTLIAISIPYALARNTFENPPDPMHLIISKIFKLWPRFTVVSFLSLRVMASVGISETFPLGMVRK